MKNYIKNSDGKIIFEEIVKTIQENKEYLTDLDSKLGDGDHGFNMNKGVTLCYERTKEKNLYLSDYFAQLGDILLNEIGGSIGPLYGMFFLGMAENIKGKEIITASDFLDMLNAGLNDIKEVTDAQLGDKTLLDTLIPAIEAFKEALTIHKTFSEALEELMIASEKGKDSTKGMIAKYGRGRNLGEASKDYIDVSAASCNLILEAIASSTKSLLSTIF
ncbi:MAG TPA: dihydroxyacetone kinase subunit DhaL [Defluviitaleaceae bacterium]|nr:dihydroxyacetone kinase subunit DhaL [Defluviitaleaceae bacterium]